MPQAVVRRPGAGGGAGAADRERAPIAPHLRDDTPRMRRWQHQAGCGGRCAAGAGAPAAVPAHPIAGAELSGVEAASADLYRDRLVVLTPTTDTDQAAAERVQALWSACGARVVSMEAARHDAVFAAVSHLPHVLAFALVHEIASRPDASDLFAFAGAGFRDFTRIAASSPEMWRDICLANKPALLAELDAYRTCLDRFAQCIAADQGDELARMFGARLALAEEIATVEHLSSVYRSGAGYARGVVRLQLQEHLRPHRFCFLRWHRVTEIRDLRCGRRSAHARCARATGRTCRPGPGAGYGARAWLRWRFPSNQADLFSAMPARHSSATAALTIAGGHYRLSGVPRMRGRSYLVDGLRQIGADVRYLGQSGFPPLALHPAAIQVQAPIAVRGDVSSQFLTALLMALPLTGRRAVVEVTGELISKPYVEITLNLMRRFGVVVERQG